LHFTCCFVFDCSVLLQRLFSLVAKTVQSCCKDCSVLFLLQSFGLAQRLRRNFDLALTFSAAVVSRHKPDTEKLLSKPNAFQSVFYVARAHRGLCVPAHERHCTLGSRHKGTKRNCGSISTETAALFRRDRTAPAYNLVVTAMQFLMHFLFERTRSLTVFGKSEHEKFQPSTATSRRCSDCFSLCVC